MAAEKSKKSPKGSTLTPEEIVEGFQSLRNEQRSLANKISEMEIDVNEHKIVIDALNNVADDRKCFRMINGILVERTVRDVKPVLVQNRDQLDKTIKTFEELLTKKGIELNTYKEKYNIRVRDVSELEDSMAKQAEASAPSTAGVLVEKS